MGSCVLRETIRKGRPRFAPRVSLSIYLYLSIRRTSANLGKPVAEAPNRLARHVANLFMQRCMWSSPDLLQKCL
jgi:hypothetical protein